MEQTSSSSSDNTVSSQQSLPSSHDPGWNDPPEWALSSQYNSSGTSQNKRVLNKRVAFPLSSHRAVACEKALSGPSSHMMLPTLGTSATPTITTAPHKPLMAPGDKVSKTSESDFDKEQALMEVLTNLKFLMTERKMEKCKIEEIQRRLDVMKFDWTENKLDSAAQKSILDMSKGNNTYYSNSFVHIV